MNQHGVGEDVGDVNHVFLCLGHFGSFFGHGWESSLTKKQSFILLLKRDVSMTVGGMKTGEREHRSTTSSKLTVGRRNFETRKSCDLEKHYLVGIALSLSH